MASLTPALNRDRPSEPPTRSKAWRERSRISRSAPFSSPGSGIEPMFLAANDTERFTRLPQVATSSSLLRRRNSLQVKSVSWFSGPAAAT